jgi:hypothetical protein
LAGARAARSVVEKVSGSADPWAERLEQSWAVISVARWAVHWADWMVDGLVVLSAAPLAVR